MPELSEKPFRSRPGDKEKAGTKKPDLGEAGGFEIPETSDDKEIGSELEKETAKDSGVQISAESPSTAKEMVSLDGETMNRESVDRVIEGITAGKIDELSGIEDDWINLQKKKKYKT